MFLLRTEESYPSVILKYAPYLSVFMILGRDKLAKVKYYRRYQSLPESTQRKLPREPSKNEVFLSTDRRDRDPIDLTQILGKCQVGLGVPYIAYSYKHSQN